MFRGYWLAAIALELTLSSVALAESAKQPEPSQTKNQWQYYTGDYSTEIPTFGVHILEEPKESERAKRSQQESAQREIEDLVAQKRMADAADESVWLTKLQFFLGIVGAIALFYSLHLTRKATYVAERAVSAANRATEEASEIGQAQVRAYLSCDSGFYRVTDDKVIFKVRFTNRGQSPTLNCEMKAEIVFMALGSRHFRMVIDTGLGVVGVGETRKWEMSVSRADIGDEVYALLIDGAAIGNIVFDVKWTNVFMKVQSDQFFAMSEEGIKASIPNLIDGKCRRRKLNVWATKINIEHI